MRNVWKGLVVGGLTGVAAGGILDAVAKAAQKAAGVGDQVVEHAPDAGHWVQSVATKAGEWLHETDVPGHIHDAAVKIKEADLAGRAADAGKDVASAARQAADAHSS